MITIKLDDSIYLNEDKSYFIKFPYDMEILNIVKSLKERRYHAEDKSWEISTSEVAEFKSKINQASKNKVDLKYEIKEELIEEELNPILDINVDDIYEYKTMPYEHQKYVLQYGMDNESFLLCDDQGLGKTKEIIDLMCLKKDLYDFRHVLIVCGINDLKWNWQKEVMIHSNETSHILGARPYKKGINKGLLKTDILLSDKINDLENIDDFKTDYFIITNIESFRDKKFVDALQKVINEKKINAMVVDEIHKIKSLSSQQTKGLLKVSCHTKIGLTGTPLVSNPLDAYVPLKWIGAEHRDYFHFTNTYCEKVPFKYYDKNTKTMKTYHEIVGYKNMDSFKTLLQKHMLRRLKEDVLDLPDKILMDEYVELGKKQQKLYSDILTTMDEELVENLDKIKLDTATISKFIRLRQALTDTSLLSSSLNESAKIDRATEIIEDCIANGEKVVLFDIFTDTIKQLKTKLKKYNPAIVIGEISDKNAEIEKFRNNDDCKLIMGTIGALGTGYTLVEANNVIFLNNPWTYAERAQAEDRCHRIGASKTVVFYTLIAKNTIDEKIDKLVKTRQVMTDSLIDDKVKNRDHFSKKELTLN